MVFLESPTLPHHPRVDEERAHAGHADPRPPSGVELGAKRLGKVEDGSFRCAVVGGVRVATKGSDGGNVDNVAIVGLQHPGEKCPYCLQGGFEEGGREGGEGVVREGGREGGRWRK